MRLTAQLEIPTETDPNLSGAINLNVIWSEIAGGVYLRDVAPGTVLEVQTDHHVYHIVSLRDGDAWISGHPEHCPDPVLVKIYGSTWGGSMLMERFIGRGMFLEFGRPDFLPITTSRISDIRQKA